MSKIRMRHKGLHPLVAELEEILLARTDIKIASVNAEFSVNSGVDIGTVTGWRTNTRKQPMLFIFDTVLRYLGYKLAIVPLDETDDLRRTAKQFSRTGDTTEPRL